MDQAVSALLKEGMSVNKASKIFNVPRKILSGGQGKSVSKASKMYNVPCKFLRERERETERERERERERGGAG